MVDYHISSNPRCDWWHGKQTNLAYIFQLPEPVLQHRTTWVISSGIRAVEQESPLSSSSTLCVMWSSETLPFGLQSYTLTCSYVRWSGASQHYFLLLRLDSKLLHRLCLHLRTPPLLAPPRVPPVPLVLFSCHLSLWSCSVAPCPSGPVQLPLPSRTPSLTP